MPSPSAMKELSKSTPSTLAFTLTRPLVPKKAAASGQTMYVQPLFSGFSELPHQTSCPACLAFNHSLKVEKSRSLSAIGRGRTSLQDTPSRFHSAKLFQFCVLCEDLTFRAISQAVLDARSDRPGHVAVATGCRAATKKEQRQHRRRQACLFHLRSSLLCWPCRCR